MKANQPDHQVATMCGVLGGSPGRRYAWRGRSGCWPCALPESDSDPDGETQLTVSLNRARTAMNFPSLPDPFVSKTPARIDADSIHRPCEIDVLNKHPNCIICIYASVRNAEDPTFPRGGK